MNETDIPTIVRNLIAHHLEIDPALLTDDTMFADLENFDSLDFIEMLMTVEEKFAIELPDDDVQKCATVKNVIDLIVREIKKRDIAR